MSESPIPNPFRPGAGHMPPYLAGREEETKEFLRLLDQDVILENLILTGLRGVGKTVLLDTFKPLAIQSDWLWAGNDISESVSISEERLAIRLITDISIVTSAITLTKSQAKSIGFVPQNKPVHQAIDFNFLISVFQQTPGMVSDKLKAVLEFAWDCLRKLKRRGLVFAYDEAQNLADNAEKNEYPLSLLLDVFQSIQKKDIPFMLVLVGLPTLFPKLVEARTFSERMFHTVTLDRLSDDDSRDAVTKPIEDAKCPLRMTVEEVNMIVELSGGYPYFIQFLAREAYDVVAQQVRKDGEIKSNKNYPIPFGTIIRKLDGDFFLGRWARATDRQRDMMTVVAHLPNAEREFSVQEVVTKSREILSDPFASSNASQMLAKLSDAGLIFKNRHGKYSFAVPLMSKFIQRQLEIGGSMNAK